MAIRPPVQVRHKHAMASVAHVQLAQRAVSVSDSEWEGDLEKEEAGQNTAGDTKARQVHLKL